MIKSFIHLIDWQNLLNVFIGAISVWLGKGVWSLGKKLSALTEMIHEYRQIKEKVEQTEDVLNDHEVRIHHLEFPHGRFRDIA